MICRNRQVEYPNDCRHMQSVQQIEYYVEGISTMSVMLTFIAIIILFRIMILSNPVKLGGEEI